MNPTPALIASLTITPMILPAVAETPLWHFEFVNGRPVKLVWQTEPGKSYNLRESGGLQQWAQVPGFPKLAGGTQMEHAFTPAERGFFDISTVNAGGGWQRASVPPLEAGAYFEFTCIEALGTTHLWAAGSVKPGSDAAVVRSADGGQTWALAHRAAGSGFFGELQMVTPLNGYAAGSGLLRTFDGGTTWQPDEGNQPDPPGTLHPVGPVQYVYGMAVVDAEHVWTGGWDGAGAGVIYHRVPGRPQPDPLNPNPNTPWWLEWGGSNRAIYGMGAANSLVAWAVGFAGIIWKTEDGQNWGPQTSNTGVALQDVTAIDASTAWAVGDGGTILKTADGGATWTPQTSGTGLNLHRIAAVDSDTAWTVGDGGVILYTNNGGTTWTRQFSGTAEPLFGVAAVNATTAWAAGSGGALLRTNDAGAGAWPAPVITAATPAVVGVESNPAMTVTLTGSGFRGGDLRVFFGETPAETLTWISETTVRAAFASPVMGTLDITVRNEDGQQATLPRAVTALPPPVVTGFSPLHAPAAGGYQITVSGYQLQSVSRAVFYGPGIEESLPVTVMDSARVLITVPASASRETAAGSIVLETAENQSSAAGDFQFTPAGGPSFAVSSFTPNTAAAFTVFTFTVDGAGFTPETTVELCDRNVIITSRSATRLTGQAFGDSAGRCRVVVANSGTDFVFINDAFLLTRSPLPVINSLSAAAGPGSGGVSVTITGTGFEDGDTVTFDGYPAAITSRSATSLTVTTPPHPAGTVSVFVMTPDLERSAAVRNLAYSFQ